MPITKSELTLRLSETQKLAKGKAEQVVNVMFDAMAGALERGERIEIRGFGSFEVRSYKPYEGRNPRTGETVHVKAKRLPFFKVGKELRENINASTAPLEGADENDPDEADDGHEDDADDADVPATD
ncbi:MAG: integration host factor subunit beta [Myxococcales bacterium]|jgi:integration host factor subunit beta|nr:integration host factor subunit beta [Myxococcales bacterium]MBK7194270.1 integration host factor subunit beta [Myxococcales bacterium]